MNNQSSYVRKISIAGFVLVLVSVIVIAYTLISLSVNNGEAGGTPEFVSENIKWSQELAKESTIQTYHGDEDIFQMQEQIENHLQQSENRIENHIKQSQERFYDILRGE